MELPGCCVKRSCAAAPTLTVKEALVAGVSEPSVALIVYVPAVPTIWQPLKLASPLDAALLRPPVQVSVAPLPG